MPCLINDPIWGFSGPYFLTFEPEKLGLRTISTQWQIQVLPWNVFVEILQTTIPWNTYEQLLMSVVTT